MTNLSKIGNYAFIDSQNLNLGTQKMGWKMDWRKFRKVLETKYGVSHAYMFIGHMPEHEDLYDQMHSVGFLVVLKPTLETMKLPESEKDKEEKAQEQDGKPQQGVKGNIDADLVLWAVKEMPNYNKAIIVSGDGDFLSLIEYLADKKKLLNVMTPNWQYSSLLKPYEEYIVRIDKLRSQLSYRGAKRK
jgi:hypothetical protein